MSDLHTLARQRGVATSYVDMQNNEVRASDASLLSVIRLLDFPNRGSTIEFAQPVCVAWNGEGEMQISPPDHFTGDTMHLEYNLENGEKWAFAYPNVQAGKWKHPRKLPTGYHTLLLQCGKTSQEVFVISAPDKAYMAPELAKKKVWGVFAPLYALGDISDLTKLATEVGNLGGKFIGILPTLASFYEKPFQPSPYVPISRYMWNEIFIDVSSYPPKHHDTEYLDYKVAYKNKKRILKKLCADFFAAGTENEKKEFELFLQSHPDVEKYAKFRSRLSTGRNYHKFVQWIFHKQISALKNKLDKRGIGLYLDLPLGVHPNGFDVAQYPELFVRGAHAGAPPDTLFIHGQDWGFPPLHPEILRRTRYAYLRKVLSHHLSVCRYLRIDHVMQLYRLFWIPEGFSASDGVYVRYPHEEITAILCLESHRHQAHIIGENLGTVPPEVNQILEKHQIFGMVVAQYALDPNVERSWNAIPEMSMASLNTHDMFPFKAYWTEEDIDFCVGKGILPRDVGENDRKRRREIIHNVSRFFGRNDKMDPYEAFSILSKHLAKSRAKMFLLNLEDALGETRPQNIPGTTDLYPNWTKKLLYPIEKIFTMNNVVQFLTDINNERQTAITFNG